MKLMTLITILMPILAIAGPTYDNATIEDYLSLSFATHSRVPYVDSSGKIVTSSVTNTELGYLSGVTSSVQTQLGGKEPTITLLPTSKGGLGNGTFTSGSIPFYNGTIFAQDNSHLFWNNSTKSLQVTGDIASTTSVTDTGTSAAIFNSNSNTTVDGSNTTIGINGVTSATVQSGATNDKGLLGINFAVTRGDTTDTGTLHEMDGSSVLMFNNSDDAGLIDKSIGYSTTFFSQHGTVTNLYDYYSERVPAGPGVVTTHYGVYITNDSTTPVKNWLSGSVRLGGSSFSAPPVSAEAAGAFKIGNDSVTCDGSVAGSMRWTGSAFEGCDGSSWAGFGGGGGANVFLSNLDASTGVNSSINPANDGDIQLGATDQSWNKVVTYYLTDPTDDGRNLIDMSNALLFDGNQTSVDWNNRTLNSSDGAPAIDWSTAGSVSFGGHQITNLAAPALGTDAANKSYVDKRTVHFRYKYRTALDHTPASGELQGTETSGNLANAIDLFINQIDEDGKSISGFLSGMPTDTRIIIKDVDGNHQQICFPAYNQNGVPVTLTGAVFDVPLNALSCGLVDAFWNTVPDNADIYIFIDEANITTDFFPPGGDTNPDTFDMGSSTVRWKSLYINNVDANKGVQLTTSGSQPSCNSGNRGMLWLLQGGSGVPDSFQMCMKKTDNSYAWVVVKAAP